MRIVCPSCAVTNRLPDQWQGRTFVCRKCSTLVTAPALPGARIRPWVRSKGWLAVLAAEAVLAAAAVAFVGPLLAKPPAGLPLVPGPVEGLLQMAVPGKTLALEWPTRLESLGGHFSVTSDNNVRLFNAQGHALIFVMRIADSPWPAGLLERPEPPPAGPVTLPVEIDLPTIGELAGTTVRLAGPTVIEYIEPGSDGRPPRVRKASLDHDSLLTVATPAQESALERYQTRRVCARWETFLAVMAFLLVGAAASALAQKYMMVICPQCGRATEAAYYFEAGRVYVSNCPHATRKR